MATTGPVPAQHATSGSALKRCPLCAAELSSASSAGAALGSCPNCGFDVGQIGVVRRKPAPTIDRPVQQPLDSLDRWLAGETIEPKSLSDRQLAVQWMRRHPRAVSLAAALLLAAVIVPVASLSAYSRTAAELRRAKLACATAEAERTRWSAEAAEKTDAVTRSEARLQSQLRERQELENCLRQLRAEYAASQQQCQVADKRLEVALRAERLAMAEDFTRQAQEMKEGLPEISLVLAAKALSITQQEGIPPIPSALQQVRDLLAPSDGLELRGHDGPVALLAASPDGSWLASGDHQGLIRLWSTTSRPGLETPRLLDGHWGRITQLVFTSDNRFLVSGSTDSTVHLWQLAEGDGPLTPLLLKNRQGRFATFAISDDGRWLAIAGAGHVTSDVYLRLWDLHADDILASSVDLPTYQGQLCSLAVSFDGDWLATGNEDGAVRLWRISKTTHAVIATDLRMHSDPVRAIRFAPDGRSLITAAGSDGGRGSVRAWSLDGGAATADVVLADNSRGVERFALTPDGHWLFTASDDPALRVRDLSALHEDEAGRPVEGQTSPIQAMAVSANNRWLATAGTDNTVRLWYIGPNGPTATPITIRTPRGLVTDIAFTGKGNWLATGNDRGNVQLWNLQVDELIRLANLRMMR